MYFVINFVAFIPMGLKHLFYKVTGIYNKFKYVNDADEYFK